MRLENDGINISLLGFPKIYWKLQWSIWITTLCKRDLNMKFFRSAFFCFRRDTKFYSHFTAWKVSRYEVFPGQYFPVFGLSTGKYRPEKTLYLDTFHAMFLYPLKTPGCLKYSRHTEIRGKIRIHFKYREMWNRKI